ncbi:MAG TPA: HAMP domain-containing sensor histidine kinase [Acidimicrobiales bacterium]
MDDAPSEAARAREEIDAIRRRVINVVGHAFRTPVTTLCGMAETLAHTDDAATRAALAEGVIRNARLVERLLDQLLLAADVSTVLPVGDATDVDVEAATRAAWDCLDTCNPMVVDAPGITARVRPAALEHILLLVLDNADKYGDGDVVVKATTSHPWSAIEIESTGAIPSDEEMAEAFELFYRGEHAVMRTAGIGVGLPVARKLAEIEGGNVTLFRRGDAVVARIELPA